MIERILIVGTGLIGASTGLALKAPGFAGHIAGWDASRPERLTALEMAAVDEVASSREEALSVARHAHVIILAVPVLAIQDWLLDLAPILPRYLPSSKRHFSPTGPSSQPHQDTSAIDCTVPRPDI